MDSDCIPHRHFVMDHWNSRAPETVLCGRRVDLGEEVSRSITPAIVKADGHQRLTFATVADILRAKTINWEESIRLPVPGLGRLIHWKKPSLLGSNFSLGRSLFERVNGFNED